MIKRALAVGLVVLGASALRAAVYTTEASFLADPHLQAFYLENFSGVTGPLGPTTFSQGGWQYVVTAPGDLYGLGGSLSANQSGVPLTVTFTGAPVTAVGGLFFPTAQDGSTVEGDITVKLSDGTSQTITTGISLLTPFVGFTSDVAITSMTISPSLTTDPLQFATMDHFYVGGAPPPVPEPFTMALCAAGLGLAVARRRAKKA